MDKCGWCGQEIKRKPVSYTESPLVWINGEVKEVIWASFSLNLCCYGCAWAFSVEAHRLMGFSGKDLRAHLIEMHGFSYPPGKPAGGMRRDCLVVEMARSLASLFVKPGERIS